MKRINYLLSAIVLLSISSCQDDFLDRSPYGSISSGNMWTTENLTDMGVAGVYNILRVGLTYDTGVSDKELVMLERYSMSGQQRPDDAMTTGTITPGSGVFSGAWQDFFEGIHRANDAITNIPEKSPCSEEKKARLVAECKFLRAYYYFRLNQVFKGVPVYLEPVIPEECTKGQSTEDEVWQVIIDDLTDCINEANLPPKYAAGNSLYGHITKGAAYALRGKSYLYRAYLNSSSAYFQNAVDDFSKVSECGYGLFQGGYRQLFTTANEQCEEMIFAQQNIDLPNYGGKAQFVCGARSSYGWNWNRLMINPAIVELYYNADGSKFDWNQYLPGYNEMVVAQREVFFLRDTANLYQKFIAKGATVDAATKAANGVKASVNTRLNALTAATRALYLPDGNEARLRQAYDNRDPRLNYNVITPYSDFLGTVNNTTTPQSQVYRWPIYSDNYALVNDVITNTTSEANYLHRKWVHEGDVDITDRLCDPTDFPIIRYGDVVLMWAEALVELNQMDAAIEKINLVKARAGAPLLQETDATKATYVANIDDVRNQLRNERRMEFVNEGVNYFDEMRWKTWKESVFDTGGGKNFWGVVIKKYSWKGDFLYTWPAPTTETQRNPNITKTPGWTY